MRLTKLEGARRQLETAIRLYFKDGDKASIHTLAAAAYSIIRAVNTHRGGEPMLKDLAFIEDKELVREARKYINQPDNFLKHADEDPDEELEFDPRWTEVLLWEASRKYSELAAEENKLLLAFIFWFVAHHPELRERFQKELLSHGFTEAKITQVFSLIDSKRFSELID